MGNCITDKASKMVIFIQTNSVYHKKPGFTRGGRKLFPESGEKQRKVKNAAANCFQQALLLRNKQSKGHWMPHFRYFAKRFYNKCWGQVVSLAPKLYL